MLTINCGTSSKSLPPANKIVSVCLSVYKRGWGPMWPLPIMHWTPPYNVCLSVHKRGWGPIWPLPMMHWTSPYRDLSPPPPAEHVQTSHSRGTPPFPRTCSNLFIMKHVPLSSDWLASYWNAFLFLHDMVFCFPSCLKQGNFGEDGNYFCSTDIQDYFSHSNELASRYHMVGCSTNRYTNNRCLKLNFTLLFAFKP